MIQVWQVEEGSLDPGKLVGFLDMTRPDRMGSMINLPVLEPWSVAGEEAEFIDEDEARDGWTAIGHAPMTRWFTLPVKTRRLRVIPELLNDGRFAELAHHYRVPEDAEIKKVYSPERMDDEIFVSWPVVAVDLKTHEELFDYDVFQPYGEESSDSRVEKAWWIRYGFADPFDADLAEAA